MAQTPLIPSPSMLVEDIDLRFAMGQISQTDHDRWIATLDKAISGPNARAVRGYVSLLVHRELQRTLSMEKLSA